MDWLLQIRERLERQVLDRASQLLGLEADLLFFDYPANNARDLALASFEEPSVAGSFFSSRGALAPVRSASVKVERGCRDMRQVIDLRAVYHRKEERLRARHPLLARVAENATGKTWP